MASYDSNRRNSEVVPILAMVGGVLAWLWPIGLGGKMPVGGDVTQFALGPLSVLGRALKGGRLPLWNDLWGYGFPGVGESQMGVFYPPHWFLYGFLSTEVGFTTSLVAHTVWGALGTYFASRRFGASAGGAALGGFAWAASGFAFIHLPHHWASTTGSWMPWAWGLAWSALRDEERPRDAFLLAVVLTVQLLAGHFQLALGTQVGILILILMRAAEVAYARVGSFGGIVRALGVLAGSYLLAAMQVWPTFRLARLAGHQRDFEYLSGFAASPLHLVTFVAPGLFEVSPLWRPVVWDPFHTSPEEYLGFVGVVPLFLAFGAIGFGWKRSAAVRALTVVGLATLGLGLGPYLPGFRNLCVLPGFSFFRAPARWILGTSLAFCLLGAIGFDGLTSWRRPGSAILRFVIGSVVAIGLVIGLIELALLSTERPGLPWLASAFAKGLDQLPWGETSTFDGIVRAARRPFLDHRVEETWARQGVDLRAAPRPIFANERLAIYRQELTPSVVVFGTLLGLGIILKDRRQLKAALILLTFLDLIWLSRQGRVDLGPIASLEEQSPVLKRLAREPQGVRTIDPLRNMPMVVGAAPVSAYRTLDLPTVGSVTALAGDLPGANRDPALILSAIRATGAGIRIFDRKPGPFWPGPSEPIADPALAGWLLGGDWVRRQNGSAATFWVAKTAGPVARGWLIPLTGRPSAAILGTWTGDPRTVIEALKESLPLDVQSPNPEHRRVTLKSQGPALVVFTELADPQWEAGLMGRDGKSSPVKVFRAFGRPNQGAWQAVKVPGSGAWTISLEYRARDVGQGLAVSAGAWGVWGGLAFWHGRKALAWNRKRNGEGRA